MSFSRRKFLQKTVASSASLVLPAFKEESLANSAHPDQRLLEAATLLKQDLYVAENAELQLHIGEPSDITFMDDLTWEEFKSYYYYDQPLKEFLEFWEITEANLNEKSPGYAQDHWYGKDSSNALAYHLLRSLELGMDVEKGLLFNKNPSMASDYIAVHAQSKDAVDLLQKKLFKLDLGVRVYYTNVGIW